MNPSKDTPMTTQESEVDVREAARLVSDLASQEWQEADGSRRATTDNFGKRLWFIGDDVMQTLRTALRNAGVKS